MTTLRCTTHTTRHIGNSFIALAFMALTAVPAWAGPPLVTDDAGTVEPGHVEIELNGSYTHDRDTIAGSTTTSNTTDAEVKVTTGLYKDMGISLAIPYTFSGREEVDGSVAATDGFGDMTLELKYAFAELAGIQFTVKPTLVIPTGRYSAGLSEGRWQPGVVLIATREFDDGNYAVHANVGYEHHDYRVDPELSRTHLWSGSVAGEMKLTKGLTGVLDFGVATNPDKGSDESPAYALAGARYEVNDHLDLDAGIKVGLAGAEDDISALYGLVLKF